MSKRILTDRIRNRVGRQGAFLMTILDVVTGRDSQVVESVRVQFTKDHVRFFC